VGQPGAQAKLITHQVSVKSAAKTLRARIAQQIYIYITWKYKFLVDSLILNWTKVCFREECPLGS
jgi:hypothetical protein